MQSQGKLGMSGRVKPTLISRHGFYVHGLPAETPLKYVLRTLWFELTLRARLCVKGFWRGLIRGTGVIGVGRLYATVIRRDGQIEHLGLLSTRLVTDAAVALVASDWNGGGTDINAFNYHGCGTGTTAEAVGDTALVTECTTALNPDSTRATGTKSNPSANVCRTVGTLTFDAAAAVTEHGVFTQATAGGTLLDRSVFAAVNVASGDSIQFTYDWTLSSGG